MLGKLRESSQSAMPGSYSQNNIRLQVSVVYVARSLGKGTRSATVTKTIPISFPDLGSQRRLPDQVYRRRKTRCDDALEWLRVPKKHIW